MVKRTRKRNIKHNLSKHPLYAVWTSIKQRCYNTSCKNYKYYGLRNIKMCTDWKDNFISFYYWSISNGYKSGLSIERKKNNQDYNPMNCIWTTNQVQSRNRRSNRLVTAFGETKVIEDWIKDNRCKVHIDTLRDRLNAGISAEHAMSSSFKLFTAFNEKKNLKDWSRDKRCVVEYTTLRYRVLKLKMSIEQAITYQKV